MLRSWKAQARSTASSTYSSGLTSMLKLSKCGASFSFLREMRKVMFHVSVMTLLLVWAGVILTIREKRSLFGNARRGDIQLSTDHVGSFFGHRTQGGGFSASDGYQSVNV